MAAIPRGFDTVAAARHLVRKDPTLKPWIRKLGPLEAPISWKQSFDTADALARSILYQQLSGKAAATIVGRVETAIGGPRLSGAALDSVSDEVLRTCGVSGAKTRALRDLVARQAAGEIPSYRQLVHLSDDVIIDRLTAVRGIGRWTAEMLLMFRLGRPDVLPADDLGVRKGAQRVDGAEVMLTPKQLIARSEAWGPYRTYAAMLLWRIADLQL